LRELKAMLSERDLADLQAAPNMPGHCLYILYGYVYEGMRKKELSHLPGPVHTMMLSMIQNMAGYQGQCMRIKNFQIAYGYLGHLRLFLVIWLFILPLSIVESSGWWTILWSTLITYGVSGMELVAHELSDPFGYHVGDIPMSKITGDIQANVRSIYAKSLQGALRRDENTPDLRAVPESTGQDTLGSAPEAPPGTLPEKLASSDVAVDVAYFERA
jgi:ion channel-forming bestrophin family protein